MYNENLDNMEEKPRGKMAEIGQSIWEMFKVAALAIIIIIPIRVFLFQPFFVQGASMEPNFEDGEYLIVNELGYKTTNVGIDGVKLFTVKSYKDFQRGDVVIFHPPQDGKKFFIKRVVALPGERIEIRNNQVTITKKGGERMKLDEGYLGDVRTMGEVIRDLSEDEYYVMGDNREVSSDSRSWGPVSKDRIVGKVLLRAWPLNRITTY